MTERLVLTFRTKTPPQWERFVKEYPDQICGVNRSSQPRVTLNGARWRLMCAIQREINTLTTYKRDPKGNDHWRLLTTKWGVGSGDCEEFALTKWALLREAGFPTRAVWPVICLRDDEPHMVTVVSTQTKDYVMDITPDWVHNVRDSQLKWLSAYDGERWRIATM